MLKAPARLLPSLLGAVLLLVPFQSSRAQADPLISAETPLGVFTNMAARLLRSELGVNLARIELYPTNRYTPAVHRLLQFSFCADVRVVQVARTGGEQVAFEDLKHSAVQAAVNADLGGVLKQNPRGIVRTSRCA